MREQTGERKNENRYLKKALKRNKRQRKASTKRYVEIKTIK